MLNLGKNITMKALFCVLIALILFMVFPNDTVKHRVYKYKNCNEHATMLKETKQKSNEAIAKLDLILDTLEKQNK